MCRLWHVWSGQWPVYASQTALLSDVKITINRADYCIIKAALANRQAGLHCSLPRLACIRDGDGGVATLSGTTI